MSAPIIPGPREFGPSVPQRREPTRLPSGSASARGIGLRASVFSRAACVFALVAGLAYPASSQSDWTHLLVRVVFPDDAPVGLRLRVQLTLQSGAVVDEYIADERGVVSFSVQEGIYLIKVTGAEIEDAVSGPFEIFDFQPSHEEYVHVRLKPGYTSVVGPARPVSAMDLKAPPNAKRELEKGRKAAASGNWAAAQKHFEKALALYPFYVSACDDLGVALTKAGDMVKAREAFLRAIQADDQFAPSYFNLARMEMADGKPSVAETLLLKALAGNPLDPQGLTLLAHTQLAQGKLDAAVGTVRKVHSVPHQGFAQAHVIAGIALENRRLPLEARAEYEEFLKEAPKDPDAPTVRAALKKLPTPETRNPN